LSILDRHDETARRLISEIGGRLVKQAGDGLLALCEAPGHELTEAGVQLRAGVHITVRVMEAAKPGEILVPQDDP
jgi:class 3 adenylate cyclase